MAWRKIVKSASGEFDYMDDDCATHRAGVYACKHIYREAYRLKYENDSESG